MDGLAQALGVCPGPTWASLKPRLNEVQDDVEGDHEQGAAKKRERAATARPGQRSTLLGLSQEVDLDVFPAALLARPCLAPLQPRLLMTSPRHVR